MVFVLCRKGTPKGIRLHCGGRRERGGGHSTPASRCWKVSVTCIKGTVSQDLLLLFFSRESDFLSKICGDIYTQGAPPVSRTPAANLPPIPLVSLILVANLRHRWCSLSGEKIRNGPTGILWG